MIYYVTFFVHTENFSNQPSRVIRSKLIIYNSQSSKPNKSTSPFKRKKRRFLATLTVFIRSSYSASSIVQSFICCTPLQNLLFGGKDRFIGATLTKGNNILAVLRAPTSTIAPPVVSILSSMARYSEDDLQRILKNVLDFRPPVSPPAFVPAPSQYKCLCERPLKAWLQDVYLGKTHLECYNFF